MSTVSNVQEGSDLKDFYLGKFHLKMLASGHKITKISLA